MKRLIMGNTGKGGNIDTDEIALALTQYRNTPLKGTDKSPAQLLLGRQLRDGIPQSIESYKISDHWQHFIRQRELALGKQNSASKEYHDKKSRNYERLEVGTMVTCQNTHTKKWDKRRLVVEVLPHRQYKIKMEGSGRVSLRNGIHLPPLLHFLSNLPFITDTPRYVESASPSTITSTHTTNITTHSETADISTSSSTDLDVQARYSTSIRRPPDRYGD